MNLLFGVPALAGPGRLKAGHHTDGTTQTGSWSQCTASKSWELSMSQPTPTPPRREQTILCLPSVPLLGGVRGGFRVPLHGSRIVEALHDSLPAGLARNRIVAVELD